MVVDQMPGIGLAGHPAGNIERAVMRHIEMLSDLEGMGIVLFNAPSCSLAQMDHAFLRFILLVAHPEIWKFGYVAFVDTNGSHGSSESHKPEAIGVIFCRRL